MNRNHRRTPFPGPIPAGMMRVSADIPMAMWAELRQASRRRGVDVGELILAALSFATTACLRRDHRNQRVDLLERWAGCNA